MKGVRVRQPCWFPSKDEAVGRGEGEREEEMAMEMEMEMEVEVGWTEGIRRRVEQRETRPVLREAQDNRAQEEHTQAGFEVFVWKPPTWKRASQ